MKMSEVEMCKETLEQGENSCDQKERLYEKLVCYDHSDYYGFHMPGHKRNHTFLKNELPYGIDITEIDGFDDLHHAKGILKKAQERAASAYHAEETFFLINGSTSGLLSGILGCTDRGGRILVARNCHKSVYAAIEMNELEAIYLYPSYEEEQGLNGVISGDSVAQAIEQDLRTHGKVTIQAVVITSPTYDGVVSDIEEIAGIVHPYQIPLIVDEAHGAHFGFHPYFPKNSNQLGADVVIQSLHKTLPSLTQTALIHLNGSLISRDKVGKYIHMLQTSSPSYVLMASIDECIRFLAESEEEFETYSLRLKALRQQLSGKEMKKQGDGLRHLKLVETEQYDPSKIIISTRNTRLNGKQLYDILREKYHLQMEMASQEYILAMTSVCDREEGFARLQSALFEIDQQLENDGRKNQEENELASVEKKENGSVKLPHLEPDCTSAEAVKFKEKSNNLLMVPFADSVGKVSLEYVYVYPPGIPLIVPGEIISEEAVHLLREYENIGFDIEGLQTRGQILVKERN